jgi:UDP-glucuronate 4-epimerase
MRSILVTGCAGFIGSHLTEFLLSKNCRVIGIDNFDDFYSKSIKENNLAAFKAHPQFSFYETDITKDFTEQVDGTGIDAVVHLAAKAGVRPSIEAPGKYMDTNITGTSNVHAFMLKNGIKKLVFASSSSVYGNQKKVPFSEDDSVDFPISPYAFTKKSGELLNFTMHHLYKTDIVNLRFFTVYGPRQRPDLAIHKFIKNISHNQPITIFGDGETARDYTYVEDTVNGVYNALEYCLANTNLYVTLNLGNNQPVKLKDLVDIIYKEMNTPPNINRKEMQPGDVDITYADITKAGQLINYKPATDISTGIKKFVAWFNKENATAANK